MIARHLSLALASLVLLGLPLAGCFGAGSDPTSTTSSDLPAAVKPPCDGAVLHDRNPYSTCSSGGNVTQMEDDTWCCPDGTKPTTHTVVEVTDTPCGGTIAAGGDGGTSDAAPACGSKGSTCDSTVCTGNARCTTKYGGCVCATTVQQNCGATSSSCYDSGCANLGGTCAVYSNGNDTGCYCGK